MKRHFLFMVMFLAMAINVGATDYYVDNSMGSDENPGTSSELAWKTLKQINDNLFYPGDVIYLKRGEVWEEQLDIPSSGTKDRPIVFTAYGNPERNPMIKLSNSFADWTVYSDSANGKIWAGKISGVKNSWGAVKNEQRLRKYLEYSSGSASYGAPDNIGDMNDAFFYAPLNSGRFYFRFDEGHPGEMEIGSRQYGINISNKKYVVIEGIDVFGPGGGISSGSSSSSHQIYILSSDNITLKNCTVNHSYTKSIMVTEGSNNCIIEDVTCYDHGSTGIYLLRAGVNNIIRRCEVYDTGSIISDYGDMGCIGFESSGLENKVDSCYVHDNGFDGVNHIDAAISIFNTPNTTVNKCYVKNSADKAIMFSENSDYSTASYNIIDNWGVHGSTITKWPSIEGLRLGGGGGGIIGCKVYNNLFMNGSVTKGDYAALTIQNRNNSYTKIKNNIFYDIKNVYDIKAESLDGFSGWEVSNNLFYRTDGKSIYWGGSVYDNNHIIGNTSGFFSYDKNQGKNSLVENPAINKEFDGLSSISPCIDNGANVGINLDYNGNSVPYGNGVDIGPFEFMGEVITAPKGLSVE